MTMSEAYIYIAGAAVGTMVVAAAALLVIAMKMKGRDE